MLPRTLATKLREAVGRYPVVSVTGPRQSGKTTLVRDTLAGHGYVSLELPDERALAVRDPRAFLGQFKKPVIIDEAQRAPDLFSYIQVAVDERPDPGRFVLTGSQNFLLLQAVSQSLAGRCAVLHLLPFSQAELGRRAAAELSSLGTEVRDTPGQPARPLAETLFTGFYPRIHDRDLPAREWLANYYQTYLERDVRSVLNVGDIETFGRFVRLCAARADQRAGLLWICMNSSSGSVSDLPTLARSIACPPAMPREPEAIARSLTISNWREASSFRRCSASSWNASVCRLSPTSSAVASSYCLWQVGLPRRSTSSSMHGISSCTNE